MLAQGVELVVIGHRSSEKIQEAGLGRSQLSRWSSIRLIQLPLGQVAQERRFLMATDITVLMERHQFSVEFQLPEEAEDLLEALLLQAIPVGLADLAVEGTTISPPVPVALGRLGRGSKVVTGLARISNCALLEEGEREEREEPHRLIKVVA